MNLIGYIVKKYFYFRRKNIYLIRKNAILNQKSIFNKLVEQGKKTKYWKENNLHNIISYDSFKNKVPLVDYDGIKKYIFRSIEGEENVLWKGKTKWFAKSSGTSNDKSKFIPVTKKNLEGNHYKAGLDLYSSFFCCYPKSNINYGKSLIIGGSQKIINTNSKTKAGDISSILIKNLPFWTKKYSEPSTKTILLPSWESKLENITKECSKKNITFISGAPSWALIVIEKIISDNKKKYIQEVWKNFKLVIYGGMAIDNYKLSFQRLSKKELIFFQVYNASEGFFAFQDKKDSNEMLLLTNHDVFYEFKKTINNKSEIVPLWEVEKNTIYSIVITTTSGLWRYEIGDTIEFCSINPYRIKFVGRTQLYINSFGEELTISNVEKALNFVSKKCDVIIKEFIVAPKLIENNKGGFHEWIIEFKKKPENINSFEKELDKRLKELNSDYEAKREKDILLKPLKIIEAKENTFKKWLTNRGKLGGQNKIPRLNNNRKIFEEILQLVNNG